MLLIFNNHKKKVKLDNKNNLCNLVNITFNLKTEDYFLQVFDTDFEEFVDLDTDDDVTNKCRINIVLKKKEVLQELTLPETNRKQDDTESLTASSSIHVTLPPSCSRPLTSSSSSSRPVTPSSSSSRPVTPSASSRPVTPSTTGQYESTETLANGKKSYVETPKRVQPFPQVVNIPADKFSTLTSSVLRSKSQMPWKVKQEILDTLSNYIYQFTAYPSMKQRESVAKALVDLYPHLWETVYGFWI